MTKNDAAPAADAERPLPGAKIARMYYTVCEDPHCGAINDYADTRADAEKNRRRHLRWHRLGGRDYDPSVMLRRD